MSENHFNIILEDCVARLADGESLADCIQRYPDYAADLEILLESGLLVQRIQASDAEVARSQARVAERFESALSSSPARRNSRSRRSWRGLALAAALLMLLLFTNIALAQDSIPGDWNYGIKRLSESAVILLTNDDMQFMQRRFDEINLLLELRREANIDFAGDIVAISDSSISIAGLRPEIVASPEIISELRLNQRIRIVGVTDNVGRVVARRVEVIEQGIMVVSPTPLFTETATPTVTASPNLTRTVTFTVSPTVLPTLIVTIESTQEDDPASCVVSAPLGWIAYVIQSGDSLFNLAQRAGTPLERVTAVNCIEDPSLISVGQMVYLPVPQQNGAPNVTTPASAPTEVANPTGEVAPAATRSPVRPSPTSTRGR